MDDPIQHRFRALMTRFESTLSFGSEPAREPACKLRQHRRFHERIAVRIGRDSTILYPTTGNARSGNRPNRPNAEAKAPAPVNPLAIRKERREELELASIASERTKGAGAPENFGSSVYVFLWHSRDDSEVALIAGVGSRLYCI